MLDERLGDSQKLGLQLDGHVKANTAALRLAHLDAEHERNHVHQPHDGGQADGQHDAPGGIPVGGSASQQASMSERCGARL